MAQNNLGMACAQGRGVAQSAEAAALWFRRAAERGHQGAQYNWGLALAQGAGTAQDLGEALRWFDLAAEGQKGGSNSVASSAAQAAEQVRGALADGEEGTDALTKRFKAAGGGHELSEQAAALWSEGLQAYDKFTGHFTTVKGEGVGCRVRGEGGGVKLDCGLEGEA